MTTSSQSEPVVRLALPDDRETLTASLIEAFSDDPLQRFMFPRADDKPGARPDAARRFMLAEIESHISHGHVYVAGDGAAAALWEPPGVYADGSLLEEVIFSEIDEATLTASADQWGRFLACRPEFSHFYLAVLGASHAARGAGMGTALLQRVLSMCDAEGIPSYLESSNSRNVSLYQRHGYEIVEEIKFTPDVIVRPMLRTPR